MGDLGPRPMMSLSNLFTRYVVIHTMMSDWYRGTMMALRAPRDRTIQPIAHRRAAIMPHSKVDSHSPTRSHWFLGSPSGGNE